MSKVNATEKSPPPYFTYNKLLKISVGEKKNHACKHSIVHACKF